MAVQGHEENPKNRRRLCGPLDGQKNSWVKKFGFLLTIRYRLYH